MTIRGWLIWTAIISRFTKKTWCQLRRQISLNRLSRMRHPLPQQAKMPLNQPWLLTPSTALHKFLYRWDKADTNAGWSTVQYIPCVCRFRRQVNR